MTVQHPDPSKEAMMAGNGQAHLRHTDDALLRVENLVVEFPVGRNAKVHAVSDVSLDVRPGETLGLVGESGCGKSTTGKAIMQLPRPTSGAVRFDGSDLTGLSGSSLRRVRPDLQMIFQDPISSLNPRRRVGDIVAEPLRIWAAERHPATGAVQVAARALRAWAWAAFAGAGVVVVLWLLGAVLPYLANNENFGLTGLWDAISVSGGTLMVNGIAFGSAAWVLANLTRDRSRRALPLTVVALAVTGVLLGLSVSGDSEVLSTLVWAVGVAATAVAAVCLVSGTGRRDLALMDQLRAEHDEVVRRVLGDVGLDPDTAMNRRPHEFSGGQCQRICIARALVLDPKVIICDEPVSALDVSVQAQILNLLQDMKARYDLTLVFIAHDLAVVKNVSDRVAVMYLGKVCEVADPDDLYAEPAHPYTAALLTSIPVPDPTADHRGGTVLTGELPSPVSPPSGCRFRTRCPQAQDRCATDEPMIEQVAPGHYVACHFPLTGPADGS